MSQLGLILQTGLIIYLLIFFPQNTQDSNPEMLRTFQLWIFEECPFKKGTVYYYLVWFIVFRETPQICSLSPVRHHNTLSPCHKAGSVVKALVYQKVGGSRHSTASLPLLWPWAWPLRGCVSQLTLCPDPNKLGYMGGGIHWNEYVTKSSFSSSKLSYWISLLHKQNCTCCMDTNND